MVEGFIEETNHNNKSLTLQRSVASRGFWDFITEPAKVLGKVIEETADWVLDKVETVEAIVVHSIFQKTDFESCKEC